MEIRFHNTQSGRKETFIPIDPERLTIYACGPTVYNLVHIGNGRPAVVFDVLYRLLKVFYREVVYARNVTDVDDKINAAAKQSGRPIQELADRFTAEYQKDVADLGALEPAVEPRATQHIPEIIEMIQTLIDKGNAYAADGHVLFHVPSDPEYGSLSRRSLEDLLDGARVEVASYKKDPKDFVLWKPSTDDLPGWDSPWGRGRPGWHIECSAMIRKHLGRSIDIHGGGSDLMFPHHENEAAQSRCANDHVECVRYWLHNGMLTLGHEKMSKSVGNIVTIRELLKTHSGEKLRYALLSGQYRSPLAWSQDLLNQAGSSLDRLYQALRDAGDNDETSLAYAWAPADKYPSGVLQALADDLNTPQALAAMHRLASAIHRAEEPAEKARLAQQLLAGGWLLGLLTETVHDHYQTGDGLDAGRIDSLIAERNAARDARDFARADAIRNELTDLGIELEDTRDGTRWKISGD
ncbi:MAG: cysteine--tRNA ligase [Gammaproteobacteria bacterium]|nr:cysteine--tRNA ligase [Gammaproteobacteria bacterium]